jgi:hypothetical protein
MTEKKNGDQYSNHLFDYQIRKLLNVVMNKNKNSFIIHFELPSPAVITHGIYWIADGLWDSSERSLACRVLAVR